MGTRRFAGSGSSARRSSICSFLTFGFRDFDPGNQPYEYSASGPREISVLELLSKQPSTKSLSNKRYGTWEEDQVILIVNMDEVVHPLLNIDLDVASLRQPDTMGNLGLVWNRCLWDQSLGHMHARRPDLLIMESKGTSE